MQNKLVVFQDGNVFSTRGARKKIQRLPGQHKRRFCFLRTGNSSSNRQGESNFFFCFQLLHHRLIAYSSTFPLYHRDDNIQRYACHSHCDRPIPIAECRQIDHVNFFSTLPTSKKTTHNKHTKNEFAKTCHCDSFGATNACTSTWSATRRTN